MTDSKTRKVIILENTYTPTFVKEAIAKALFDNLRVRAMRPVNHAPLLKTQL